MQAIILCGGLGTRLREETEYKPKPMVEIGGKPILWHIMKIFSYYGINDFILALGYKGDVIRNYFLNYNYYNNNFTIDLSRKKTPEFHSEHNEKDWKITFVETGLDSKSGYMARLCKEYVKDDYFLLTYGDAVCDINISRLIKFHKKQNTIGTVTGVFPPSRFGDLEVKGNKVIKFKEKIRDIKLKAPINGGFFVFKKEFFNYIPDDKECDLERLPMTLLTKKNQLSIFKHDSFWQCMDTYRDYELLNNIWINNPMCKKW